jgi:hypothetical protein
MPKSRTPFVIMGAVLAVALLALGFIAVQKMLLDRTVDSYFLAYEVTSGTELEAVSWTTQQESGTEVVEESASGPVAAPFDREAIIPAGAEAKVVARVGGDGTAGCRIVRDPGRSNETVLVEASSIAPGEPVTCEARMPTGEKYRR